MKAASGHVLKRITREQGSVCRLHMVRECRQRSPLEGMNACTCKSLRWPFACKNCRMMPKVWSVTSANNVQLQWLQGKH